MKKEWNLPERIHDDIIQQILKNRELDFDTMNMGLDALPDEALFANIDVVAQRIKRAMYNNEPLVIFGHDDPDGVTSTYILYRFLNSCGYQRHHYYIPNRQIDSHGIQQSFIDFVQAGEYKLIVTVDNGISSYQGVAKLNEIGCDVIITDHHLIQPDTMPNAHTILNPQLPQCQYPFKQLAGVGVVMMLIRYLSKVLDHPVDPAFYFWTAVGSIADKVPLVGVNWVLVHHAIEHLLDMRDYTIDFLLRNYSRINTKHDAFSFINGIARLIANGREEGGQHTAIRFMLQLSDDKALLFEDLEKQKNAWENDLNRVFKFLDTITADFVGSAFVYYDDDDLIPYSLLGTAASYIVNHLGIPAIMLKMHNEKIVCEGRCTDGFNIVDSFTSCKMHLLQYGGHPKAAGFVMQPASYNSFIDCFNSYLASNLQNLKDIEAVTVDLSLEFDQFNRDNWKRFEELLPFGQKNPEPVVYVPNTSISELSTRFSIENSSINIPYNGQIDVLINWRNYGSIRIIDYRENQSSTLN